MKRLALLILAAILTTGSVAFATGTLTIPVTFGSLTAGRQNSALFDTAFSAVATYINQREITQDVAANRPAAGIKGRWYFSTNANGGTLYGDTGTSWTQLAAPVTGSLAEQFTGLTVSNDAGFPGTFFDVVTGAASSDDAAITNRVLMILSSTFAKSLAPWVVGTVQGCLDTGSVAASTWYHIFLIQRLDTGNVDLLCSTSATAPVMPTNYTKKRRIWSILTDANIAINFFTQRTDQLIWATAPALNINSTNPGTGAFTASATCPNGVVTEAIMNVQAENGTNNFIVLFSPLVNADQAPSATVSPLGSLRGVGAGATGAIGQVRVWTNTASSFRVRFNVSGAGDIVRATTVGCVDPRGRG